MIALCKCQLASTAWMCYAFVSGVCSYQERLGRSRGGDVKNENRKTVRVVRWIARILAGLAAVLILLIFIGEGLAEGFEPILHLSVREAMMMVAFVAMWLGLVLGWKWELVGGLLTICGAAAFYLLDYAFSGTFPRGPFFLILASPSLLFLYCGLQTRKQNGSGER
jgi:hypothetical protein